MSATGTGLIFIYSYKYFEKRRILEGKKKTANRLKNEDAYLGGVPIQRTGQVWVAGRF